MKWLGIVFVAVTLSGCANRIEQAPLDMPLVNPTPRIAIVSMPVDQLARIDIPMCHDGKMGSHTNACVVPRGDHYDIIMPVYGSIPGAEYSELFAHELEGHVLRGLCHIVDGKGWKPCSIQ